MARFIAKRIGLGLITLWLLSILVFFMANVLPGNVARRVLGPFASQKAAAQKIQTLLLDETPNIYAYFYYFLTGTKKNVGNVEVSAMGHYDITKAGFTTGA